MTTPPSPPVSYAGPGKRLGGFIIDALILSVIAALLAPLTGVSLADLDTAGSGSTFRYASQIVAGLYNAGFVALRGQTPGKMVVSTRVVDATTYRLPALGSAVLRAAVPIAASFVPVIDGPVLILIYLWLLWDPRRQGLHDKVANTVVIDK